MSRRRKQLSVWFALWCLSGKAKRAMVHKALSAAIDAAIDDREYEVAANLRDLREGLTEGYRPPITSEDGSLVKNISD